MRVTYHRPQSVRNERAGSKANVMVSIICMTPQKLGTLLFTALICAALLGCKKPSLDPRENQSAISAPHNGTQWLSWRNYDRDHFVSAYIDGYLSGVNEACRAADRLLDLKTNRIYEHDSDEILSPSGVCRKGAAHYSKFKPVSDGDSDVSAYTDVLTRFYAEHPQYQNVPYEYLMQYLTDEQYKTADDLYNMAKAGSIRTNWHR